MRLVWGQVSAVESEDSRRQALRVELDDGSGGKADCYIALVGRCESGDRVLVNTTAVDLGLGTGGSHVVVARAGEGVALEAPSGGHIMKLRYTPMQHDVMAVEAPESPHHEEIRSIDSLEGLPVVCCSLHSQIALVAAAVKAAEPSLRVVFCMTDQAALPAALSRILGDAAQVGLIDAAITCGQSFGGDLEAVNLHSGLLAALAVAQADVAIVSIGPGVVGTSTPFGHGGIAQGEAVNAAVALQGRPIAALRLSFADERERHRGVSHHTLTAVTRVALGRATVAVPELSADQAELVESQLARAGVWDRHARADAGGDVFDLRGLEVKTMGRSMREDPAFFAAAFAAGEVAASYAMR